MRRIACLALLVTTAMPGAIAAAQTAPPAASSAPAASTPPQAEPPITVTARAQASRGPRRIFISPMGQPFRGTEAAPDPERAWFDSVDTNHDGALTLAEFKSDAGRFFTILDRKRDGEIDPDDIDYYENTLAPEVRSGNAVGSGIIARVQDGEGGASTQGTRGVLYDAGTLGAARFSYFDLPEPVTAADRNFNRGVDPMEFGRAAEQRFDSLDKNHNGKLTWDELPHVRVRAEVRSSGNRDGGERRGRGAGRRPMGGGMNGGMSGGIDGGMGGRSASGDPMN
ncbi:EF-hand domain-containing protein [Sphingomonas sp. MA1305]|uniref:EF-hand domain-containing protein n=1 Tax=Sphingomonas sp. MA1305 TaxID=2479204 RepID=UPI0018DF633A|nr:EF-hand domain-containing protein [Sphingomonas sp. MA1305]